jgi:hypothetical protein
MPKGHTLPANMSNESAEVLSAMTSALGLERRQVAALIGVDVAQFCRTLRGKQRISKVAVSRLFELFSARLVYLQELHAAKLPELGA